MCNCCTYSCIVKSPNWMIYYYMYIFNIKFYPLLSVCRLYLPNSAGILSDNPEISPRLRLLWLYKLEILADDFGDSLDLSISEAPVYALESGLLVSQVQVNIHVIGQSIEGVPIGFSFIIAKSDACLSRDMIRRQIHKYLRIELHDKCSVRYTSLWSPLAMTLTSFLLAGIFMYFIIFMILLWMIFMKLWG